MRLISAHEAIDDERCTTLTPSTQFKSFLFLHKSEGRGRQLQRRL